MRKHTSSTLHVLVVFQLTERLILDYRRQAHLARLLAHVVE